MLDQLYGKPSTSWRRSQVFLVLLFWALRLAKGDPRGPPVPLIRRLNRALARFTPWQTIVGTLTFLYAIRHTDCVMGLQAPEPLARLYSRNYYRATWIVTALDAGFATAMDIKPKFIRDIFSILFSGYYLLFASEADEKLRKYRAMCTVEMLRVTWEKTGNPYVRWFTKKHRPRIPIRRKLLLARPKSSSYTKPITIWLFFGGSEKELSEQTEIVFDVPGGGFICMSPEHHEERLIRWTNQTGRPILSVDYGKAPEYPYPFAIDECYDAYMLMYESNGKCLGMKGSSLSVILSGDSAGANIATALMIKLLESRPKLPQPVAIVYAYAALSFHFTSWMPSSDLRVLRQESHSDVAGILRGKEHHEHRSPLSVVEDVRSSRPRHSRTKSWGSSLARGIGMSPGRNKEDEAEEEWKDEEKSLSERVVFWDPASQEKQEELQRVKDEVGKEVVLAASKAPLETKLAMTSRTAFFNDRIISPPMCRAMALLYIGPRNVPDLHSDYHISPIFTPPSLLCQFPPVYMSCGERDPFIDDTVIFAGKLREAKEGRRLELLAKANKFGESLRMSGFNKANKDPLLDQTEEDWVQMKIIEGWSHGYLQMVSLLPEAEHAISMMADWIVDAFDKDAAKTKVGQLRLLSPAPPRRTSSAPDTTPEPSTPAGELEDPADDEDEVLSFTPRRKSGTLSPATVATGVKSSLLGARGRSGSTVLTSSSDESSVPIAPTTPPDASLPTPPTLSLTASESASAPLKNEPLGLARGKHLLPHERVLREELSSSLPALGRRSVSLEPRPSALLAGARSASDEDAALSADEAGRAAKARTGSGGQLPPAHFVEAKDLLKRRRDVAVFGLSNTNSAAVSDEEGSGEETSKERDRKAGERAFAS